MIPKVQEGNFIKDVEGWITKERHPEYLKQVLEDYATYKSFLPRFLLKKIPNNRCIVLK